MSNSESIAEFGVKKRDLPELAAALQIPDQFVCKQRSVAAYKAPSIYQWMDGGALYAS